MTIAFGPARPSSPQTLSCEQAAAQLFAFIDNELPAHDQQATQDHLANCHECAHEHHILVVLKQLVKKACYAPAPHGLRERVASNLGGESLPWAMPTVS